MPFIVAVTAVISVAVQVFGGKFGIVGNWAVDKLTKKKAPARQASVITMSLAEAPREAIFGTAATAGNLLNAYNYGGNHGTDWEVLVIKLADHRCHSLLGFWVDDTYYAFGGDGNVTGFNSKLAVYFLNGQETQTLPAIAANGSGFSSGDFKGICAVFVAYKYDKNVWSTGRPSFLWHVKGKLCYDPRKDSTVTGGSGAHRWGTPSTWEWSENAAVCRYNWVRGVYACDRVTQANMLLVGRGLSSEEAPPERILGYANICDEDVTLKAGGTEDRYRVGCVVRSDEPFEAIEERFAAAMAGELIQREGAIEIEPGYAKTSVVTITDDDIDRDATRTFDPFITSMKRLNSVVPRFVDPAQKWRDAAAPLRRNNTEIAAEGLQEEDYDLPFVTSHTQAQRCAEIYRRLSRLERRLQIQLGPRFSYLEDGDWLTVNSARYTGGVAVLFRVESYALDAGWNIVLSLREIAANVYSWTAASDELDHTASPAVVLTPPGSLTMPATTFSAVTFTGLGLTVPGIEATWSAAALDPAISGARMEYRVKSGPGASRFVETQNAALGRLVTGTVSDGVLYEARIQPICDDPQRAVSWSAWADVTTPTGTGVPPSDWEPPLPPGYVPETPQDPWAGPPPDMIEQ